jgi:dihydropteroate synthase
MELRCGEGVLDLSRTAVMGVLNVTPDSFSDGGLWLEPEAAIKHGLEMVAQGAAIVDVGGESTRPGAEAVEEAEELRRVLPVIEGLKGRTDAVISIDTRKPSVARRALESGAAIINDTAGEASTRDMDVLAAETGAAIVVMHSRGTPATMRELTDYSDVVTDVRDFLERRANELIDAGVGADFIALDPGIGFAKNPRQNLELLHRMDEIVELPWPILVGTSRKSFIGAVLDLPEDQRIEGTLATVVASVMAGVKIVRVHDVEQSVRSIRMIEAVLDPGSQRE